MAPAAAGDPGRRRRRCAGAGDDSVPGRGGGVAGRGAGAGRAGLAVDDLRRAAGPGPASRPRRPSRWRPTRRDHRGRGELRRLGGGRRSGDHGGGVLPQAGGGLPEQRGELGRGRAVRGRARRPSGPSMPRSGWPTGPGWSAAVAGSARGDQGAGPVGARLAGRGLRVRLVCAERPEPSASDGQHLGDHQAALDQAQRDRLPPRCAGDRGQRPGAEQPANQASDSTASQHAIRAGSAACRSPRAGRRAGGSAAAPRPAGRGRPQCWRPGESGRWCSARRPSCAWETPSPPAAPPTRPAPSATPSEPPRAWPVSTSARQDGQRTEGQRGDPEVEHPAEFGQRVFADGAAYLIDAGGLREQMQSADADDGDQRAADAETPPAAGPTVGCPGRGRGAARQARCRRARGPSSITSFGASTARCFGRIAGHPPRYGSVDRAGHG